MTVSVTFSITSKILPAYTGDALEGAIVRVFSEDGETFVTQGTTDSDGELVLELEDETTYWVRFFKATYEFPTRLTIDVDSSASSNTFDVEGTYLMEHPPSANEYLCRISGYVRGADWAPRSGIPITFSLTGKPRVVAGQVMVTTDVIATSDSEGWIEVELVRNGAYDALITGMEDTTVRVLVPDEQSASITDVLFPYALKLEYGTDAVELEVLEEVAVTATVTLSSGVTTPFELDDNDTYTLSQWVTLEVSDKDVIEYVFDEDDNLVITGKGVGVATITATALETLEVSRTPAPTRSLASLTVTVT